MRRLLVTGAAGFIGANFIEYWQQQYPQDFILALDALTYAGNIRNLERARQQPNFEFVQGNIADQALIEHCLRHYQLDTLVNFAAESHVDRSISDPAIFLHTNILGTFSLLQAARTVWQEEPRARGEAPVKHRFHHVSTDEVFGDLGEQGEPFVETSRYQPSNPYSATKAASDHLLMAWARTYGLHVSLSNCSNNFGIYQYPEKLMPRVITNILHNRPLPVFGSGLQVRDWLYVHDHAAGIDRILQAGQPGCYYNIGGRNERTNIEVIKLLCESVENFLQENPDLQARYPQAQQALAGNAAALIQYVADRPGHDQRYAINPDKIERELGFRPQHDFRAALRTTVEWYLQHSD
ncbi:dTDP-glucose 4,6-dehydratase [Oceanospirillaceae bacterium ASx5O]|nr:dTDP-glucose 4,6-dehydratase [Oceanospirillaceae bacterium ASx5O]